MVYSVTDPCCSVPLGEATIALLSPVSGVAPCTLERTRETEEPQQVREKVRAFRYCGAVAQAVPRGGQVPEGEAPVGAAALLAIA